MAGIAGARRTFLASIAQRAQRHACYIVINVSLRANDGGLTVSSLLYGPAGRLLAVADKQTLMGHENTWFGRARHTSEVITTPFGRLAMFPVATASPVKHRALSPCAERSYSATPSTPSRWMGRPCTCPPGRPKGSRCSWWRPTRSGRLSRAPAWQRSRPDAYPQQFCTAPGEPGRVPDGRDPGPGARNN